MLTDADLALAAEQLAHATEVRRRELAESQRDTYLAALRSLLATLPNEWAPHEVQMARMLCREMVKP